MERWGKFEWKHPAMLCSLRPSGNRWVKADHQGTPLSHTELSIPAILSHWLQMPLGKGSLSASHNIFILGFWLPSVSVFPPVSPARATFLFYWEVVIFLHVLSHLNSKSAPTSRSLLGYKVLWPKTVLPDQKVLIRLLKLPLSPPIS